MDNYLIKEFNSNEDTDKLLSFCRQTENSTDIAAANMWNENWQFEKNTLPYIILKTDQFKDSNGRCYLLCKDGDIIGCSGIYRSSFSNDVAIAGVRLWINKKYRNLALAREYFLPRQKLWAIDQNFKIVALTFNDYNKNLIELWKRTRLGKQLSPRVEKHLFFDNFNQVSFPVNIKYTKQWVIYEKLDRDFNFDWNTISYKSF